MAQSSPVDKDVCTLPPKESSRNIKEELLFNIMQFVHPILQLSEECTEDYETQKSSSEIVLYQGSHHYPRGPPRVPPIISFYSVLKSTTFTRQAFDKKYRYIRGEGMIDLQLSRVLWERVQTNPHVHPLLKCMHFSGGVASSPENLDYILQTWNDLSQQLIKSKSFEIGNLMGLYLVAWTIYNRAEYGHLPNDSECIQVPGPLKITLSKEGAMKLIDYCIEKMEFMSEYVRKPYFYITKLRWQFEYKRFMGNLDESEAHTILKGLDETVQLCNSFEQEWAKDEHLFGILVSVVNQKIEIALYFLDRLQNKDVYQSLKDEIDGNLIRLSKYFKNKCSNISTYEEGWLYSVQSKYYRMIGEHSEARYYAARSAHRFLESGRHWKAVEEAQHSEDKNLVEYCEFHAPKKKGAK